MSPTDRIYAVVARIPKGKVATYGDVARMAKVGSPRIVGSALHKNKDWKQIPCHRVVNSVGRLAPGFGMGGAKIHESRLRREGVAFRRRGDGKRPGVVDLKTAHWRP